MNKQFVVDVIIPTYKPDEKFIKLLNKLKNQTYPPRTIIVVNTDERYFDNKMLEKAGNIQVHHISPLEFDHGGTRALAAKMSDADILVYMTQDAVPKDENLLEYLIEPFRDESVGAAYARQIPEENCKEAECFTRNFNYPETSLVKSKEDIDTLGIKTYFCSNVCAAYRKELYTRLGGFVERAIFNEDMIYAGKLIQSGGKIAYVAKAEVIHSHNYGNIEQFQRNFDLAVSQVEHPEIFGNVKSETEGIKLVKKTISHLRQIGKAWLVPDLIIKSGFKFIGYQIGKKYKILPKWLILKCTMNKRYWKYVK